MKMDNSSSESAGKEKKNLDDRISVDFYAARQMPDAGLW
jgi:hypothetical protein